MGVAQDISPDNPTTLFMLLWASTDGGRTWAERPPADLPGQGQVLGRGAGSCGPVSSPHLAFATAQTGWFTEGDCGSGPARPRVWRTTDGGRRWSAALLPAPASGWGSWDRADQGGADMGAPWLFGTGRGYHSVGPRRRRPVQPGGRALDRWRPHLGHRQPGRGGHSSGGPDPGRVVPGHQRRRLADSGTDRVRRKR